MYNLKYTQEAVNNLNDLKKQGNINKLKKIKSTLEKLSVNPRHPGLHTHKNQSFTALDGEDVFQSYVENNTPSAFRIFWCYGPNKNFITVIAIIPHP